MSGLSFGYLDRDFRLTEGETAEHTILFDPERIARGIDVSVEGKAVLLRMNLPTSSYEIRTFYDLIEKICGFFKTDSYFREGEKAAPGSRDRFIWEDERTSVSGLEELKKLVDQEKTENLYLFGARNPIAIGPKEEKEIGLSLENLGSFLHKLQSMDVYYATPNVFDVNGRMIGLFAIGPDVPSVVPGKPHIIMDQVKGIESWYAWLGGDGKTVRYQDFIENTEHEYYDAGHVIVKVSPGQIDRLVGQYHVEV